MAGLVGLASVKSMTVVWSLTFCHGGFIARLLVTNLSLADVLKGVMCVAKN